MRTVRKEKATASNKEKEKDDDMYMQQICDNEEAEQAADRARAEQVQARASEEEAREHASNVQAGVRELRRAVDGVGGDEAYEASKKREVRRSMKEYKVCSTHGFANVLLLADKF